MEQDNFVHKEKGLKRIWQIIKEVFSPFKPTIVDIILIIISAGAWLIFIPIKNMKKSLCTKGQMMKAYGAIVVILVSYTIISIEFGNRRLEAMSPEEKAAYLADLEIRQKERDAADKQAMWYLENPHMQTKQKLKAYDPIDRGNFITKDAVYRQHIKTYEDIQEAAFNLCGETQLSSFNLSDDERKVWRYFISSSEESMNIYSPENGDGFVWFTIVNDNSKEYTKYDCKFENYAIKSILIRD